MTNSSAILIDLERKVRECGESNCKGPTERTRALAHEISRLGWQLATQCEVEIAGPHYEAMGE